MASTGIGHFVMAITSDVRNKAYQKDDHHSATTEESPVMTMTSASPSLGADGVQFTPEVMEEIKDLVAQGISRDEIASRLGVSVGYLQVTCLRLGSKELRPRQLLHDLPPGRLVASRPRPNSCP